MAERSISLLTRLRLLCAGWYPSRDVWDQISLPAFPEPFPQAKRILSSFGGLRFGNRNEQVLLDSIAALEHDAALLDRCERVIGRRLYPIGYQEHQDREVIFVDESGAIYINFGATLYLIAQSFEDALVYLIGAGNYHRARLPAQKQGTEMLSWILPDESEP